MSTKTAAESIGQLGSQWLNQWGHSEINLISNSSKTLQGGGALLFPLLHGEQQLLFAQIGGHFGKTANLLNTGIGQRWFTDQGHWGYNLFHDYHFNNHHQRLSLGLEWQHNNLSIALNGYQPLTDKRLIADTPESKTFERTARGFDLRCQYRLPQHPQLRLNLTGDRYLGEIVHNDSIVHNRSAITVGFDYTPIPFITAGYGFNLDNTQNKAHQLQLILTYRLGVPLAEQFDPQQVHIARSSLSNWLNLVQRNHQITLEQLVERPEPKAEVNDGGASPQNTPPEGTQGPEEDPTAEQDLMGYNKSETADEQQPYGDSDAEIAAEQQRRKARAEARENAALARRLPNDRNSDAEIAAEQQRRRARAYAKESAALRRLPNDGNSNAEIAAEQQRRKARAEARENAALARHLPNDGDSDAEIAAEQQRRKARAEARENAALARRLPNDGVSDTEIAAEQQRLNARAYAKDSAALRCLPDYRDSDAKITTKRKRRASTYATTSGDLDTDNPLQWPNANFYQKYEFFYMPDGDTSGAGTDRQSESFYIEPNAYLDSDSEIAADQQRLNAPESAKESAALEYKAVHEVSTPLNEKTPSACREEITDPLTPPKRSETKESTPHANLSKLPTALPSLSFKDVIDSQWRAEIATAKAQEQAEARIANGERKLAAKERDTAAPTISPITRTGSRQRIMKPEFQLNNSNAIHGQRQEPTTRPSLPGNNCSVGVQPAHNAWTKPRVGKPTLANKHTLQKKTVTPRVRSDSTNPEYGSEVEVIGQINPNDTKESLKNYLAYQKRKRRR
ncbi:MAG: inverse autotransporter beta domain-containing protein [Candidatus Symbiodolus clandestinus]